MSLKVEEMAFPRGIVSVPAEALPFVGGVSPAMRALERVVAKVAPTDVPVLLLGESGTGKDVVALALHRSSANSHQPFVKCNCAALTGESLRAHFGNGGTNGCDPGNGGTIFFDDIGRLDAAGQDALLQLLSDSASVSASRYFRDRVVSSSTRSLEEQMRVGRLREELYYQINGVCLRLPALRQRQEDLPLLLDYFVKKYASAFERPEPKLSSAAMEFLRRHSWPGNIRELENFVRKLVILGDEEQALSDLSLSTTPGVNESGHEIFVSTLGNRPRSLKAAAREASRNVERELILNSLKRTHWNRKRTARELQISYKALLYKLKQLNIEGAADLGESAEVPR